MKIVLKFQKQILVDKIALLKGFFRYFRSNGSMLSGKMSAIFFFCSVISGKALALVSAGQAHLSGAQSARSFFSEREQRSKVQG